MKRTFRGVASVAGLIEKNLPGAKKTGRQATVSTDILYDTLVRYDPGHLLLRVTREEAQRGLVDFGRIEEMLSRIQGRIDHVRAAARHPPRRADAAGARPRPGRGQGARAADGGSGGAASGGGGAGGGVRGGAAPASLPPGYLRPSEDRGA